MKRYSHVNNNGVMNEKKLKLKKKEKKGKVCPKYKQQSDLRFFFVSLFSNHLYYRWYLLKFILSLLYYFSYASNKWEEPNS